MSMLPDLAKEDDAIMDGEVMGTRAFDWRVSAWCRAHGVALSPATSRQRVNERVKSGFGADGGR